MSLVSHKKSYLVCAELSNLRILRNIYLFSSSCLCPLLAVSVLYFEKNRNRLCEYSKIRQFDTYQIAFLMRKQGHKNQIHLYLGNSVPNSRAALSGSVMGLKNIGGLDISAMVQNSDRSVALWYISSSLRLPVSAFHVQLFEFIRKIHESFITKQFKSQKIYIFCLFTQCRIVIHFVQLQLLNIPYFREQFPHYGNSLLHKWNSCRGNY